MILGRIEKGEKTVRFNLDIRCSNCGHKVPGSIKSSEKHYKSDGFEDKIKEFRRNYLCGICRDKKRLADTHRTKSLSHGT